MASAAVVTTPYDAGVLLMFTLTTFASSQSDSLRPHEPARLDRPPKYLA